MLLVFSLWDRSDIPLEMIEKGHAHAEVTCNTVNYHQLEMRAMRTAWPRQHSVIKHSTGLS